MKTLTDRFGRVINYLRISVTDRCNLRCLYCMPLDGLSFHSQKELLSFEEIVLTVQVANRLGIDRARITGGEPLLRPRLPDLIRMLKQETGLREISMTTNGTLLARHAEALADSGLDWINVSVDSLRPDRFKKITRFGILRNVWRGVERAAEAGLKPIKINTLLLKGFNEDEVEDWLRLTLDHDLTVRFLELMPMGGTFQLDGVGSFMDVTEVREQLIAGHGLIPAEVEQGSGPARYWKVPGARGRVGFIASLSEQYCGDCNRFRLTANGELRPCLADDRHVKLSEAIKRGDVQAIEAGFLEAARIKPKGHHWEVGQVTKTVMSNLGG
jgi:cyclic pyranopterin phosphate synthase